MAGKVVTVVVYGHGSRGGGGGVAVARINMPQIK